MEWGTLRGKIRLFSYRTVPSRAVQALVLPCHQAHLF